jgi:hypothetical protein
MADLDQTAEAQAKAALEADKKRQEAARKKVADERAAREKAAKDAGVGTQVKPTPTQEENDLAASGVHVVDHEPDGSPEEKPGIDPQHKESRPSAAPQRAGYQTKTVTT